MDRKSEGTSTTNVSLDGHEPSPSLAGTDFSTPTRSTAASSSSSRTSSYHTSRQEEERSEAVVVTPPSSPSANTSLGCNSSAADRKWLECYPTNDNDMTTSSAAAYVNDTADENDLGFSSSELIQSSSDLRGLELTTSASSIFSSDYYFGDHNQQHQPPQQQHQQQRHMEAVISMAKSYPPPPPPRGATNPVNTATRSASTVSSSSANLRRQIDAARLAQMRHQDEVKGGTSTSSASNNIPKQQLQQQQHRSLVDDTNVNVSVGDSFCADVLSTSGSSSEDELLHVQKSQDEMGAFPTTKSAGSTDGAVVNNESILPQEHTNKTNNNSSVTYGMGQDPINAFLRQKNGRFSFSTTSENSVSISSHYISDTDDEHENEQVHQQQFYHDYGIPTQQQQQQQQQQPNLTHAEAATLLRVSRQMRTSRYGPAATAASASSTASVNRKSSNRSTCSRSSSRSATPSSSSSCHLNDLSSPRRTTNTVRIHVYDLLSRDAYVDLFSWGCNIPVGRCFTAMNDGLHALGSGAYHVGVEVNGIEFAYGANNIPGLSGVFTCHPRNSPGYQYRTTLDFGERVTTLITTRKFCNQQDHHSSDDEATCASAGSLSSRQSFRRRSKRTYKQVHSTQERFIDGHVMMQSMACEYLGCDYDLLRHNCCTFARDACLRLGVTEEEIPSWFLNLASTGADAHDAVANVEASVERGVAPFKRILSGGLKGEQEQTQERERNARNQEEDESEINNNKKTSAIDSVVDAIGRGLCFGPRVLSTTS